MLPSFLIGLREGLEAALIVGIVLGVLTKLGHSQFKSSVWWGVGAAVLISLVAGLTLNFIGAKFEGSGEKIFEAVTMLVAASVLTWMIFWMQKMSSQFTQKLRDNVEAAAGRGRQIGLFGIAFFAVLREGIETVLFLTAAAIATTGPETMIGGAIGLVIAAILGWAIFASTVRLNIRQFFNITSILLILFAAGLVAHGVHELNEVGWIPAIIENVWDTNHILSEDSTVGSILKAVFGYNGNPSLTEVLAYILYIAAVVGGIRLFFDNRQQLVREENQI
jgi:high-affinity iron transporter